MKLQPTILMFSTLAIHSAFAGVGRHTVDINTIRANEARQTLEEMASLATRVSSGADRLSAMIANTRFSRQSHAEELLALEVDLNRLGRDAARVNALRASLPAWQQATLDRVMPVLRETAAAAEKAIRFTRDNPARLWAQENAAITRDVCTHSRQMAHVLHQSLKANHLRESEQKVEHELSSTEE